MNKMEFDKLYFKNFLSFGSRFQELKLESGISLITGKNLDNGKANGVGKTNLLETIPFALFGKTHSGVKKEHLINWKNRRRTEVQITFTKDGSKYEVMRAIKPDKLEIYKDGDLIPPLSNVRDYQAHLEEILGINFQTFTNIIHSNINSEASILNMSKPEKRKFLEKMFGLDIYSNTNNICNAKISTIDKKLNEITIKRDMNDRSVSEIRSNIRDLKLSLTNIDTTTQSELNDVNERMKELIEVMSSDEQDLNDIESQVSDTTTEIERLNDVSVKFQKSHSVYKSKASDIKKRLPTSKAKITKKDIINLEQTLSSVRDIYTKSSELIEESQAEEGILAYKIEDITKKISIDGDTCPTCGQSIVGMSCDDMEKDLAVLKERSKEVKDDLKASREERTNMTNSIKQLEQELSSAIDTFTKQSESEVLKLKALKYLKVLKKYTAYLTGIDKKMLVLSSKRNDLNERFIEVSKNKKDLDALETEETILTERLESEQEKRSNIQEFIDKETSKLTKIESEQDTLLEVVPKYQIMNDYLACMKDICKDENIKSYAIGRLRPMLMERTNFYLSEIEFPFYLLIDSWLDCKVKGPGITNGEYKSLSGGERKSVDIAIQNGFLDILRMQSGIFPDVLVYDEVLDSSIDSGGIEKVYNIIFNKQQEDKNKVYIISHRDEVSEFKFDHHIELIKEGGYTKIYN
jgi:DNA repair exonuclease SbcCD ATPase subunit